MNNCLKTNQPTSLLPPRPGPDPNNKKARTCMTFFSQSFDWCPRPKTQIGASVLSARKARFVEKIGPLIRATQRAVQKDPRESRFGGGGAQAFPYA